MYRIVIILAVVGGCSRSAPSPKIAERRDIQPIDVKTLDGEYRCVGLVIDGEKRLRSVFQHAKLVMNGGRYRETHRDELLQSFSYKVYPEGVIWFETNDTQFLGRYELKGNTLSLCFPGPIDGDQMLAPAAFDSEKGSHVTLATWRRIEE